MVAVMAQPWWPLSPWLSTGAAWFIFFNAVVAAIAVMSSCAQQEEEQDGHVSSARPRLRRGESSTVLDQLRSFSLFSVHPTTAGGVTVPMLDDLASGVSDSDYCHCSQQAEAVPAHQVVVSEPAWPTAAVPECNDEEADAEEKHDKSMSMDEAYAMVQQRRRPLQSPSAPADATTAASWPEKKKKKELAAKAPKRRADSGKAEEMPEGKAELNARAELFIRQFREELKLQRLNSLLRHTHAFGSLDGAPVTVR